MKTVFIIAFLAITSVISFSCKKDNMNGYFLKASVNGTSYTANQVSAYFAPSSNKTILNIKSAASNSRNISLIINGYSGPKEYKFKSDNLGKRALCTYSYLDEIQNARIYTTEDLDDNGSITITRLEGSIVEGTFNFKARRVGDDDVNVSGGSFKANF